MSIAEMVQSVQCTIDSGGQITAIVIQPELWHRIIEILEDSEDRALIQALRERLQQHPAARGAIRWQDAAQEWE